MRANDVALRRLGAQRISWTPFARAEEVVAWLGAVQAQDYLGALWAVGLRLTDGTQRDIERAIAERLVVRTWPMRGTLHFIAAADARWMTELLAGRPAAAASGRLRSYSIDARVLSHARRVLVRNLEGGRQLTRPMVYSALETAGIATGGQRGLHILWRLAQDCVLCFGPRLGKQHTFVLFDEWLPAANRPSRDEALAMLAQRYFRSHGPATRRDFAWWSGLSLADARLAIELAGDWLVKELHDDEDLWSADVGVGPPESRGFTQLLPAFDEFLVGYTDRRAVLDVAGWERVVGGGVIPPVVVHDGRVLGTWRRTTTRREVVCSVAPFATLGRARSRGLTAALERYARFLGLALRTNR
jgi:hypothetical protein